MRCLIVLIAFWAVSLCAYFEGPHYLTAFVGKAGKLDSFFSYTYYHTKYFWDAYGKKRPTYNHFTSHQCSLYGEWAVTNDQSIFAKVGYSRVIESLNGNSSAFQDSETGWKKQLFRDANSAVAIQALAIVPSGNKKSSVRFGRWGGAVDFLYSRCFTLCSKNLWYDCDLGYRFYTGFPSGFLNASLAVGCFLNSWLQMIGTIQLDYSLRNGSSNDNLNHIIYHPKYRLLEIQLEFVARLNSYFSASLGITKHAWGQNSGMGGGVFGELWLDF